METTYRDQVLGAFGGECGYYHIMPKSQRNYIDGMFQVSMLYGTALRVGDQDLAVFASNFVCNLAKWNVRYYGFNRFTDDWKPIKGTNLYGHTKPQGFAGPAAFHWADTALARNCGVKRPTIAAWGIYLASHIAPSWFLRKPLKQHLNSVMLAHLLLKKKPPKALNMTTKDNPVYAYVFGEKVNAKYPNTGPWPAKDVFFWDGEEKTTTYVPTCQLVGDMLQTYLEKKGPHYG